MTADAAPPSDPFEELDATALADLVRRGEASALEVTDAAIARMEARNPRVNAVVSTRFEAARAEAAALDADPARKRAAPFAGAPFLVKDLDGLKGAPLTYGSRLFRDYRAKQTEPLIAAALDAGFIPLGKTNTPEFGLVGTTEPLLHGPTRNPWNLDMSPGGSSGGAAAATAAGMLPLAHASDGGGSIRIPAALCGLVGLKPSNGRGLPLSRPSPGDISVCLCVSRTVRDTARFLDMSDAARAAAGVGCQTAPPIGAVDRPIDRPLRIALMTETIQGRPPEPEVAQAVQNAARALEGLGHHVEPATPPIDAEEATAHFLALWCSAANQIVRSFPLIRAVACGWRVWRWPSRETALDPWTRGLAARFVDLERRRPNQLARAGAYFERLRETHAAFFTRYDVTMSPVLRRVGFPIGEQSPLVPFDVLLDRVTDNVGYTPTANALGWPALSLPMGWASDGRPIGVHFAAKKFDETTLLRLALQLEAAHPWKDRRPPLAA